MQDECYNILFRKKLYSKIDELQTDVDEWIRKYNYQRPDSGQYCYGKTPYQTFLESKHIALEKTINENSKKNDDEKGISNSLDF